jgi:hypothetical protein
LTETNVVDDARNLWTPAAEETRFFDGAPSQHRAVWYAIVTSLLPGDRITVTMPGGLSFDRAAATASFWHINFSHPDIDFHLSRWSAGMMWYKGLKCCSRTGSTLTRSAGELLPDFQSTKAMYVATQRSALGCRVQHAM